MLGLGGLARACSSLLRQSVAAPLTISSPSLSNSSPMQKVRVDPAVLDIPVQYNVEREVWVESLATKETQLTSIMPLHPDVWAVYPRMDIIHQNLVWQQKYNVVNYNHVKNVREMIYAHGGGCVAGSAEMYAPYLSYMAVDCGVVVFNVDYRLAPGTRLVIIIGY